MSKFREQVAEIVNSNHTKAKKKQMLAALGLSDSDIRQQLFAHEAAKKMAAKKAQQQEIVQEEAPRQENGDTPFFEHYDTPNKENTLYLPIKQVYFDAIIDGSKREEYREIKDTTYKKYLQCDEYGGLMYNVDLIDAEDPNLGDPMVWNNGRFPYAPKLYQYLSLAVGYAKERDTALVKITGFSFSPSEDEDGKIIRLSEMDKRLVRDDNGALCLWVIAYHLGEVVELHRKGE